MWGLCSHKLAAESSQIPSLGSALRVKLERIGLIDHHSSGQVETGEKIHHIELEQALLRASDMDEYHWAAHSYLASRRTTVRPQHTRFPKVS